MDGADNTTSALASEGRRSEGLVEEVGRGAGSGEGDAPDEHLGGDLLLVRIGAHIDSVEDVLGRDEVVVSHADDKEVIGEGGIKSRLNGDRLCEWTRSTDAQRSRNPEQTHPTCR